MNKELHLSPFWKYEENSFFRLFPFEVKKIPFCELNDGSGSPLDSALLGVKYRKCDASVRLLGFVADMFVNGNSQTKAT